MSYKLYYYPNNASLAPHFLLHHVKADYELILVDRTSNLHKSADYLRLNPTGRIPTFVANDQAIFESAAICIHICELYPESNLIPKLGDAKRPLFFQWLAYLNNTLQTELLIRIYPGRHTVEESNVPAIVAAQENRLADILALLDQHLQNNTFLLGEEFSACDYFLFMLAEWCLRLERSPLSFPHLAAYLRKLATQNATIQEVCRIEEMDLSPFITA